jgi:hypothetical protein
VRVYLLKLQTPRFNCLHGPHRQGMDYAIQMREARILRVTANESGVNLLNDHRQLEQSVAVVEVRWFKASSAFLFRNAPLVPSVLSSPVTRLDQTPPVSSAQDRRSP